MKVSREQAIKIIDSATDRGGYDDWWMELMEEHGLYDEQGDSWATLKDVFEGLGVTEVEVNKAIK